MMQIETDELQFMANAPAFFLALIEGEASFQQATGFVAANGLRSFIAGDDVSPEFLAALQSGGDTDPWQWGFLVIHKPTKLVIGTVGFKGPPDADGMVEIAYGIVPEFENRGFATLSAKTLVQFAKSDPRVTTIVAHTLPESNASTRVLQKNNFNNLGSVQDPEDGEVWRWQHTRLCPLIDLASKNNT